MHKRVLPRNLPATHDDIEVDPLVADPDYCDAVTDLLRRRGIRATGRRTATNSGGRFRPDPIKKCRVTRVDRNRRDTGAIV